MVPGFVCGKQLSAPEVVKQHLNRFISPPFPSFLTELPPGGTPLPTSATAAAEVLQVGGVVVENHPEQQQPLVPLSWRPAF